MRGIVPVFLVILLLSSACSSGKKKVTDRDSGPAVISDVHALFVQRCATCHGTEGNLSRGGAKKLTESTSDIHEIISQIRDGKGAMPPFRDMLSEAEIKALAEHVKSFRNIH